ncbi:hypothetical protein OGAPHI_002075 [Ogataea philodendri]|uniref:Uncharacterized protein n=1 Tax=Ogataea philodendri TaxID=1378263 RepID=A0A9P8PAS6_9ASCO|nr:uncharacterized protein OGAPHI_002075 [Ogataea philodendri]KAH3668321.1 hypothetical protein OGAPHI_002075 [Ogataea philodendri]
MLEKTSGSLVNDSSSPRPPKLKSRSNITSDSTLVFFINLNQFKAVFLVNPVPVLKIKYAKTFNTSSVNNSSSFWTPFPIEPSWLVFHSSRFSMYDSNSWYATCLISKQRSCSSGEREYSFLIKYNWVFRTALTSCKTLKYRNETRSPLLMVCNELAPDDSDSASSMILSIAI